MKIIKGKERTEDRLLKMVLLTKQGKILDCGCDWNNMPCQSRGREIIGIDIKNGLKGNYKQKIIHDLNKPLPFKDETFDNILAGNIIEHLPNFVGFLEECHRTLKKGGKLIIGTNNKLWVTRPYHIKEWDYWQFRKLLTCLFCGNFKIISSFGYTKILPLIRKCLLLHNMPFLWELMVFEMEKR